MNVILIEKDGNIYEKSLKAIQFDKLYSVCGYRSNKDFEKLHEWDFDKNIYQLYGKRCGKQDKENIFEFPEIKEKYYGVLCIVKHNGSITLDEWNIFYMSVSTSLDSEARDSDIDPDVDSESNDEIIKYKHDEELTYEEYEEEL